MIQHTKEPWKIGFAGEVVNGEYIVAQPFTRGCDGPVLDRATNEANARRIVACVNACRGLSTEDLEQAGLASAFGNQMLELERQLEESIALGMDVVEVEVSEGELAQQIADLENELEIQHGLNNRLNSENQALSARVLARVEELQVAVQARLAAEAESDQWERRSCTEATRVRDLEGLNSMMLEALDGLVLAQQIYRGSAGSSKRIIAKAMGRLLKAEDQAKAIIAKAKGAAPAAGEGV